MTAIKYAQKKSVSLARRLSAFFTVILGFFAIFFVSTPKILTSHDTDQASGNFFIENAYADIPYSGGDGDSGSGDSGCGGDTSDSGCAGACADGSAGSCSCGDGGGCGSSDCAA